MEMLILCNLISISRSGYDHLLWTLASGHVVQLRTAQAHGVLAPAPGEFRHQQAVQPETLL